MSPFLSSKTITLQHQENNHKQSVLRASYFSSLSYHHRAIVLICTVYIFTRLCYDITSLSRCGIEVHEGKTA